MIVARGEQPRSFGLYSAAFALGAVIVGGAAAGLPILMLRRASQGDLDQRTLRRAVGLQVGFSLLATVVTALAGTLILGGLEGALASGAAALFFTTNHLATLGQCVQSGRRRYHRAAATDVVAGTLFPILTLAALELGTGIIGALLAAAIACAVSCGVAWTGLPELHFGRKPSQLGMLDGLSFSLLGLVKAGYGRMDTVALGSISGPAVAGYYSAAYRLLGPFHLVGAAVSTVYFSRLSEFSNDPQRWAQVRRRGRRLFCTVVIGGAVVVLLVTPFLIEFFYGPRYRSSVAPARVLLLSILPWSLYWLKVSEMGSVHLEKRATGALGAGLLINVLLVVAVGRTFGSVGAAWAWFASESAMLLALSVLSHDTLTRVASAASATPETIPPAPRGRS